MKVIDLLNKIANGEDIKKFTYCGGIYEYNQVIDTYICKESNLWFEIKGKFLNDEIEIIEDTPKEDKKIKRIQSNGETLYSEYIGEWLIHKERYTEYDELLMNKINEIIDKVNKL